MPEVTAIWDSPLFWATGWILIHSLWQGTVIAVALMLLLGACKRACPQLRYGLACVALLLMVLLPTVTVLHPLARTDASGKWNRVSQGESVPLTVSGESVVMQDISTDHPVAWRMAISQGFDAALPYTVSLWWIGTMMMMLWHAGGLLRLKRLERHSLGQIDELWQDRVTCLAERLSIRLPVRVLLIDTLESPAVTGWLKPTVFFPLTALSGLSTDQIEALFLHELAHIRRWDYLVNLLQIGVEIVGFYHPAVWWVNHRIRVEREHCCDDVAMACLSDRAGYVTSLLSLEEMRVSSFPPALGAAGYVQNRIYRLLGIDTQAKTSSVLPGLLILILVLTSCLGYPLWSKASGKSDTWMPLFDGQSLTGWQQQGWGDGSFSVEQGEIVGTVSKGTVLYLCTEALYSDFELEFEVHVDPHVNSGVQFRSHVYEDETTAWVNVWGKSPSVRRTFKKGQVYGYQVEINGEDITASGGIWDESRRVRWLANTSEDPVASKAMKENAWNIYRVLCRGDHIQTWVNGVLCSDIHDDMSRSGFIGLQANNRSSTEPASVCWRNLRIRTLKD